MIAGVEHGKLLNYVSRIVGPQDAEDVCQTAYMKALRSGGMFRGECLPSSWVFTLARNAAFDCLRNRKRRPEAPMDYELPAPVTTTEDRIYVAEILRLIDPKMAEAIWAMVTEGSCTDAARSLGIPEGTLKSRAARGRKALRELEEAHV